MTLKMQSDDVDLSHASESEVGFVRYFLNRFSPARGRLIQKDETPSSTLKAARVLLHKTSPGLELTVRAKATTDIKMDALVKGDLSGDRNLLVAVTGPDLVESNMQAMGYIKSWVGYYRYIKGHIQDNRIRANFKIDPTVSSLKVMTWNFDDPVILENVTFESEGAELSSPVLTPDRQAEGGTIAVTRAAALKANLLLNRHQCGPTCILHCDKWLKSMDAFANRHNARIYGRESVYVESNGGELLPAVMQKATPAFVTIPASIDEYLYKIGDKSRNMLSKARRLGYEFQAKGPAGLEQDIFEVRTSDPMRQGRPIPEYYYSHPPLYVLNPSAVGCEYHTERFFGVFKDGRLVSYITLFMFGEFAQINHILCHKDHVKNGVMNLNLFHVVERLILDQPWVRAINYLYVNEEGLGIDLFKRSVGFRPERFLMYDSLLGARDAYPQPEEMLAEPQPDPAVKAPAKSRKKIEKWDFVFEKVSREALASVIESKVRRSCIELQAPKIADFITFFSSGLNEFAGSHPVGVCFAVPFASNASESAHPAIASYLAKRFKGNPVAPEGFSMGFKGGNFRALAFFPIEGDEQQFFDGVIVLEKLT